MYSKIAYERAEIARDMEYTKANVEDSAIQDSILSTKSKMPDAFDDMDYSDDELDEALDKIPTDDAERNEEINRILQSTEDMDLDDIMGIEKFQDEESEE